MKTISTPRDLLIEQLKDLYSAENQLILALPSMASAAASPELREAFETHLDQTEIHVSRLDEISRLLGESFMGKNCLAMAGLVAEGAEAMALNADPAMKDLAIIGAAQKAEHYEIAAYGAVRTLAEMAGEDDIAELLQATLDEEGETDERLTQMVDEIDFGVLAHEADDNKS